MTLPAEVIESEGRVYRQKNHMQMRYRKQGPQRLVVTR